MKVEAEVGSRIKSAGKQVLGHTCRAAHIGFDDYVGNDGILLRLGLFGKNTLIQSIIQPRKVARLFSGDQVDAFHAGSQMLCVAQFTAQTKKIHRKTQYERLDFVARVAANLSREFLDGLR